jgi:hypothetical protein
LANVDRSGCRAQGMEHATESGMTPGEQSPLQTIPAWPCAGNTDADEIPDYGNVLGILRLCELL